jgi:hypothetical protein
MAAKGLDTEAGLPATFAAVALGLMALGHGLLAGQYLVYYWLDDGSWYAVTAILVLSLATAPVAWNVLAGRTWAAVAGLLLAPLLGLLSVGYTLWALWNGSFAAFSLLAPPSALLALFVTPFAIPACQRAEKARAQHRAKYAGGPFASV